MSAIHGFRGASTLKIFHEPLFLIARANLFVRNLLIWTFRLLCGSLLVTIVSPTARHGLPHL
ncbi:uncharacterized protein BDV14DRAFT_178361 [Aspergillus stella-maris]|uniref:uncharacterized protein n=1 Tax=Aspergillus stella-maris TaxID=1810926 RepID=UPI003CCD8720